MHMPEVLRPELAAPSQEPAPIRHILEDTIDAACQAGIIETHDPLTFRGTTAAARCEVAEELGRRCTARGAPAAVAAALAEAYIEGHGICSALREQQNNSCIDPGADPEADPAGAPTLRHVPTLGEALERRSREIAREGERGAPVAALLRVAAHMARALGL